MISKNSEKNRFLGKKNKLLFNVLKNNSNKRIRIFIQFCCQQKKKIAEWNKQKYPPVLRL